TSTTELSTTEASPTGSNSEGSTNDGSTSENEVPLQCTGSVAGRKNAYFGDLHVHTNYSFDAYFFNELNGPVEAYAFAKGGTAGLPCGDTPDEACRTTALDAPLDFAAVTDHAEFLGFAQLCGVDGEAAQNPVLCEVAGNYIRDNIANIVGGAAVPQGLIDALDGMLDPADSWQRLIQAATDANDPCTFTSLVAYEHSAQPDGAMLHRNVVFRGTELPTEPVSSFEAVDEWQLFNSLDQQCPHGVGKDCDYITIPHNSNLSDGRMFQSAPLVQGEPATQAEIEQRSRADVLVEIMQHKGQSECGLGYANALGAEEDVACSFERVKPLCESDSQYCRAECDTPAVEGAPGVPEDCTDHLDMVRDALAQGLALQSDYSGVNPFKLGFAGATDTHNGTPGNTREDTFLGHGGVLDDEPSELLGAFVCNDGTDMCPPADREFDQNAFVFNPGGLTGVWTEENTRDSVFAAMKRREVFATSGTRIRLRFHGAPGPVPADTCARLSMGDDPIENGEVDAVPMGADLPAPNGSEQPQFVVRAVADPILGTPLQRLEIVKGWVDATGNMHTSIVTVAGGSAGPEPSGTCAVTKADQPVELCGIFTDTDYDPTERSYYYARALENPSCRWSTSMCVNSGVDCSELSALTGEFSGPQAGYEGCCVINDAPPYVGTNRFDTVEERAWSSPIWYTP
ncbi:MAG: DUF3604 domain-containing protein, partial [Deltaproteobacteria bacterium]|nr:DUF3604 domain-containing protein [Nannocystaceae bacterium]